MFAEIAFVALLVEAAVGYPDGLHHRIGHPVVWIGRLISRCERAWNIGDRPEAVRRARGVRLVLLLVLLSVVAGGILAALGARLGLVGILGCGVAMSSLLAQRGLDDHVAAVAQALERGVLAGRDAVARIVGRDTAGLDEAAIARAAIESLAENFSDAVVAPVFWLALAGPPGGIAYKAINTADSMVGHRSERYRAFGWAAARTDDLVNLPASRLAALWLVLAAAMLPGASAWGAVVAVWRDAGRHRSPNAGWPEAAMAGALGLSLAGPRSYGGHRVEDHWMGEGRAAATVADILAALRLYRLASAIQAAVLGAIVAVILIG